MPEFSVRDVVVLESEDGSDEPPMTVVEILDGEPPRYRCTWRFNGEVKKDIFAEAALKKHEDPQKGQGGVPQVGSPRVNWGEKRRSKGL